MEILPPIRKSRTGFRRDWTSEMDNRESRTGRESLCDACGSFNVVVATNGPTEIEIECMDCGTTRKEQTPPSELEPTSHLAPLSRMSVIAPDYSRRQSMFITNKYRRIADDYSRMANSSLSSEDVIKFRALEKSASDMANNEEWLKNNYDQTLRPDNSNDVESDTLAAEEEHVLRCLGAALLMQWNDVPTTMQRLLFDCAGTMGELQSTAALRGQIARFLNRHRDSSPHTETDIPAY